MHKGEEEEEADGEARRIGEAEVRDASLGNRQVGIMRGRPMVAGLIISRNT